MKKITLAQIATAAGLALVMAACADDSSSRRSTTVMPDGRTVMDHRGGADSRMTEERMARRITDANMLAILESANRNTIQESKLAQQRASHPDVRLFANRLQTDHEMMLQQGSNVASRMNMAPTLPPGEKDLTTSQEESEMEALKGKSGEDFDRAFLDHRIQMHEKILGKLNDGGYEAQNADVRTFVAQAKPGIQSHLKTARDLRRNLGGERSGGDRNFGERPMGGSMQ